jgi:dihydroorotase
MSKTPARIGRLAGQGSPVEAGGPAELTLYDPRTTSVFGASDLHGRSRNSPYLGTELPGRVMWTIHRGVATVADGVLADQGVSA